MKSSRHHATPARATNYHYEAARRRQLSSGPLGSRKAGIPLQITRTIFLLIFFCGILSAVGCSRLTFKTEFVEQEPKSWPEDTSYYARKTYKFATASTNLRVASLPSKSVTVIGVPVIPLVPFCTGEDKCFLFLEVNPVDSISNANPPKIAIRVDSSDQLMYPAACVNTRTDSKKLGEEKSFYWDARFYHEKNNTVFVYKFDLNVDTVDVFTILFTEQYLNHEVPSIAYVKQHFTEYRPFEAPVH
jgi:hypothetical protein